MVGPGLPALSFERHAMRHHYDATREAGFAYAMVYPGLQRVIQAPRTLVNAMRSVDLSGAGEAEGSLPAVSDEELELARQGVLSKSAHGVVAKEGADALLRTGALQGIEIDTAHFKGNYPDRAALQAALVAAGEANDLQALTKQSEAWPFLLPETKLDMDKEHFFTDLADVGVVSHLRLSIYPDGGVSRLRIYGRPDGGSEGAKG